VGIHPGYPGSGDSLVAVDDRAVLAYHWERARVLIAIAAPDDLRLWLEVLGVQWIRRQLVEVARLDALPWLEDVDALGRPNERRPDFFVTVDIATVVEDETATAVMNALDPALEDALIGVNTNAFALERPVQ
jgi:hypothetical protein